MRKNPYGRLALLALAVILSGCISRKKNDIVSIATFGDTETINNLKAKLDLFEQRTGIKTQQNFIPFGNFTDKIITQMAADNAPDVLWVEVGFYVPLQFKGALHPLDEFIQRDKVDLKQFYPQVMSRFTTGGKVYALPQDTAPIACIFYNKSMFQRAGVPYPKDNWRWDDMLMAAKKLTKVGPDGLTQVWGFKDNWAPDWANWIYANGGLLVDDWKNPTRCVMDSPQNVEAITYVRDLLLKQHVFPADSSRKSMGAAGEDMLIAGQLAMFRSGYWSASKLRRANLKDEWDMVPPPMGPRATKQMWSTGGSGWAMLSKAKDPEKAWKVIQFLASPEVQEAWVKSGNMQPSLVAMAKSDVFLKSRPPANNAYMVTAPEKAIYSPEHPRWEEMLLDVITPRMDLIMLGKKDVAEGLVEIRKEVDRRLFNR